MTREVEDAICKSVRAGGFLSHAASAAGVTERTLHNWLEWAEQGRKPYAGFADKILRLRGEHALRLQSILTRAAFGHIEGDWKSALALLERGWPKTWGQAAIRAATVTVQTGGDDDAAGRATVQFWLPTNGRRPDDPDPGANGSDAES